MDMVSGDKLKHEIIHTVKHNVLSSVTVTSTCILLRSNTHTVSYE